MNTSSARAWEQKPVNICSEVGIYDKQCIRPFLGDDVIKAEQMAISGFCLPSAARVNEALPVRAVLAAATAATFIKLLWFIHVSCSDAKNLLFSSLLQCHRLPATYQLPSANLVHLDLIAEIHEGREYHSLGERNVEDQRWMGQ